MEKRIEKEYKSFCKKITGSNIIWFESLSDKKNLTFSMIGKKLNTFQMLEKQRKLQEKFITSVKIHMRKKIFSFTHQN